MTCTFPDAGLIRLSARDRHGVASFKLDAGSRCFEGHFDGSPILPGVVHVALALSAGAEVGEPGRVLTGLRDLRFVRPLFPGDILDVHLIPASDTTTIRFEIRREQDIVSSGHLMFAPTDATRS